MKYIVYSSETKELSETCKQILYSDGATVVRGFPTNVESFVSFLQNLGDLCDNYSAVKQSPAYALHPKINRVKFIPTESSSFQESCQELASHAARAWGEPRPAFFASLMVHPGFKSSQLSCSGESTYCRWKDVIREMRECFPEQLKLLNTVPLPFPPSFIKEKFCASPLLYGLPSSRGPDDLGCRLSLEIEAKIQQLPGLDGIRSSILQAIEQFRGIARNVLEELALERGDLVVLDNNRVGHGRRRYIPFGESGEPNPRELWSAVIR